MGDADTTGIVPVVVEGWDSNPPTQFDTPVDATGIIADIPAFPVTIAPADKTADGNAVCTFPSIFVKTEGDDSWDREFVPDDAGVLYKDDWSPDAKVAPAIAGIVTGDAAIAAIEAAADNAGVVIGDCTAVCILFIAPPADDTIPYAVDPAADIAPEPQTFADCAAC